MEWVTNTFVMCLTSCAYRFKKKSFEEQLFFEIDLWTTYFIDLETLYKFY